MQWNGDLVVGTPRPLNEHFFSGDDNGGGQHGGLWTERYGPPYLAPSALQMGAGPAATGGV